MRFSIRQLEVFISVAKTENISQTAIFLHLTQSACSMALLTLEKMLGTHLFDRQGKKILLNSQGKVMLPKAIKAIALLNDFKNSVHSEHGLQGELSIGASSTIGNYILPKILGKFSHENINVSPRLKIANTEQVIQHLLKFEIDIGFIEGSCAHSEITITPWKVDEMIIIAHPKHSLCKQKINNINQLHNEKWILRESGSGTREHFLALMKKPPKTFLEFGHTEAIKEAVKAKLGISCLSRSAVSSDLKSKHLVEISIPKFKLQRNFFIVLHRDKFITALMKSFLQECQS